MSFDVLATGPALGQCSIVVFAWLGIAIYSGRLSSFADSDAVS
jgi:hypothetical protein